LMMERSRAGSGSVLMTKGSGCRYGRPKNIRLLRIRIPNTVKKKLPEDRVCTEHPGSSYPVPLNSKRLFKF
jgi:hypothetical protein